MADFSQALKWMKEGKKVRRNCFNRYAYYKIDDGNIVDMDESDFPIEIGSDDILADDWEIYTSPMSDEVKAALINFAKRIDERTSLIRKMAGLTNIMRDELERMGVHCD